MTDAEFVREIALPLSGGRGDYDPLLELIGDALLERKTFQIKIMSRSRSKSRSRK